jgi:hypothetical protein
MPRPPRQYPYYLLRGRTVWLDHDLADLLMVPTKHLNRVVARNPLRFPEKFSFRLNADEIEWLLAHNDVVNLHCRSKRYRPRVFTFGGMQMASCLIHTRAAISVSLHLLHP